MANQMRSLITDSLIYYRDFFRRFKKDKYKTPEEIILQDDMIFDRYKGAFTENFVLQEMVCNKETNLYYWTSQGDAELDFVFQHKAQVYPIEVKSGKSKRTKSLWTYKNRYNPQKAFCISSENARTKNDIDYYPLYLISRLTELKPNK